MNQGLQSTPTDELEKTHTEILRLIDQYKNKNVLLAELLLQDLLKIIREMFLRIAPDGDLFKRRQLAEIWLKSLNLDEYRVDSLFK